MKRFRLFLFLRSAGKLGFASATAGLILLLISDLEHVRGNSLASYSFLLVGPLLFAFGAYMAWSTEHERWKAEIERNTKPDLRIELLATFFDVSKLPGTNDSRIHIYAYLRVTNASQPETLITGGRMNLMVGGAQYSAKGDDISRQGGYIEHNSIFRLGGERKREVFGEVFTPVQRLIASVNRENPLRRGIHQDGVIVFTYQGVMDWGENQYVMEATDVRVTLTDSLGQSHTLPVGNLSIPCGTLRNVPPRVTQL